MFEVEVLVAIPRQIRFAAVRPVQDVRENRLMLGEFEIVPCEVGLGAEADDVDAFPMLGHEMLAVDDLPMHLITQFVTQRIKNDLERAPPVVRGEVCLLYTSDAADE